MEYPDSRESSSTTEHSTERRRAERARTRGPGWLAACSAVPAGYRRNGGALRKSARSSRVERGRTHLAMNQKSETLSNRDIGSKKEGL